MNKQKTQARIEQKKEKIKYKHLEIATKCFDEYFKKGQKKYGEAMAIFAIAFLEGMNAGVEMERVR